MKVTPGKDGRSAARKPGRAVVVFGCVLIAIGAVPLVFGIVGMASDRVYRGEAKVIPFAGLLVSFVLFAFGGMVTTARLLECKGQSKRMNLVNIVGGLTIAFGVGLCCFALWGMFGPGRDAYHGFGKLVPLFLLVSAMLILLIGGGTLVLAHTKKRISESLIFCDSCGYDLTGNTSGKCPECGVATKRAAT